MTPKVFRFCLLLLCIAPGIGSPASFAQEEVEFKAPKFVKVAVEESGATLYLPQDDSVEFNLALSEDGSKVYSGGVISGDYEYGIILVQFSGFTLDTKEDRENTLIAYMDFLQETYSILYSAGYGMGHELARDETAEGIIDFWADADADEWSVTGWVRPDALAVLYIVGPGTFPNYSVSQFFFNGLEF